MIGLLGGILFNLVANDNTFLILTTSSSDFLFAIFLPVLIFESAYRIEYHSFIKSLQSIVFLSVPGYLASTIILSIWNRYIFSFQHWTYVQCLMLGIIFSVTKPVTMKYQTGLDSIQSYVQCLRSIVFP